MQCRVKIRSLLIYFSLPPSYRVKNLTTRNKTKMASTNEKSEMIFSGVMGVLNVGEFRFNKLVALF